MKEAGLGIDGLPKIWHGAADGLFHRLCLRQRLFLLQIRKRIELGAAERWALQSLLLLIHSSSSLPAGARAVAVKAGIRSVRGGAVAADERCVGWRIGVSPCKATGARRGAAVRRGRRAAGGTT